MFAKLATWRDKPHLRQTKRSERSEAYKPKCPSEVRRIAAEGTPVSVLREAPSETRHSR